MKKIIKIGCIGLSLLMLSSCAGPNQGGVSKQGGGAAIGALAGGLLGSQFGKGSGQFLAMGIGALAGGLAGSAIGKSLDDQDKAMLARSSHQALELAPSGKSVEWRNPDSGHYGSVTPVRTFQSHNRYCREYQQTVVVGGKSQQAYGTACRQSDGQWEIVSN